MKLIILVFSLTLLLCCGKEDIKSHFGYYRMKGKGFSMVEFDYDYVVEFSNGPGNKIKIKNGANRGETVKANVDGVNFTISSNEYQELSGYFFGDSVLIESFYIHNDIGDFTSHNGNGVKI